MLSSLHETNATFHEVNVNPRTPMYRLVSVQLIRQIMKRTGTGAPVTVRELAAAAGVPHGTIGNLLTGRQESVPEPVAHATAHRLGVDLNVVFVEICRSNTAAPELCAAEAVSA